MTHGRYWKSPLYGRTTDFRFGLKRRSKSNESLETTTNPNHGITLLTLIVPDILLNEVKFFRFSLIGKV